MCGRYAAVWLRFRQREYKERAMPDVQIDFERKAALLPVPYVSQLGVGASKYHNDCGAASGAMLLAAYSGEMMTPDAFFEATGQTTDAYLSAGQLMRVLSAAGLRTEWQQGVNLGDLFTMLAEDRPPIVLFNYGAYRERVTTENETFSGGHFGVIVGIDTANVYLHDPLWGESGGAALTIPHDDWLYAWTAAVRDGNPARGCLVPMIAIGDFQQSDALYSVRVIPSDGLRIRRSPQVALANSTQRFLRGGDIAKIYVEAKDAEGNDWGAISPERDHWIALKYDGEVLAERI
jgi:hypothetical protein